MIEYRPIQPDEWPHAMNLWVTVFGDCGWIFESLNRATTGRVAEHTRVAVEGSRIVSAVDIFPREIRDVDGQPRKVGAIGSVATLEEYRGRGISGHLLTDAIQVMDEIGCDWSFLFTGNHKHYARYGWFNTPLIEHEASLRSGAEVRGSITVEEMDVFGQLPLAELAKIYDAYNFDRPLSHVRTPLYWEHSITARLRQPGIRLFVIREDGLVVAYLVASFKEDRADLEELGYPVDRPELMASLLAVFSEECKAKDLVKIVAAIPLDPPVRAALEDVAENIHPILSEWSMSRPISAGFSRSEVEAIFAAPRAANYRLDAF